MNRRNIWIVFVTLLLVALLNLVTGCGRPDAAPYPKPLLPDAFCPDGTVVEKRDFGTHCYCVPLNPDGTLDHHSPNITYCTAH